VKEESEQTRIKLLVPMEARLVAELPTGPGWEFEPKWDGFRCLVFKAGEDVELLAKSGKSLTRFFPEIVSTFRLVPFKSLGLDGELVINSELAFHALQMRLHPAATRIAKLSQETPATFIAFDCLSDTSGRSIARLPFRERRKMLEWIFKRLTKLPGLHLTKFTTNRHAALRWLQGESTAVDGVVAKRLDLDYRFGERAMVKFKRNRTADCVVGGFRYEQNRKLVGSLLLGLYDDAGLLHHVGFTSSIAERDKPGLTKSLKGLISPPGFTANPPGAPSRWSNERSTSWEPLKPQLVVEVRYDHVTNRRFRHGTKLVRWRPDKAPRECTFDQIAAAGAA
jgi:ATP-dependent DNA ligase